MLNKISKSNKGFTIIEVVLVLAIAAVIMGLVFFAVPAFQAQGRDTARRSDARQVLGAFGRYVTNNPNTALGTGTSVTTLGSVSSGNSVDVKPQTDSCAGGVSVGAACATAVTSNAGKITVTLGTTCNISSGTAGTGGTIVKKASSNNIATVIVQMDNGTDYYCLNN